MCIRDSFNSNRPAAENQQSSRNSLHAGGLAARPDTLDIEKTGNRRDDRIAAVRQNDVICCMANAVDLHHAYSGEAPSAAEQVDAVIFQPAFLAGIGVVGHHEVAPGERRADVEFGFHQSFTSGMDGLAGSKQRLRWNAGPVRALAADEFAFNDSDVQTTFGERTRAVFTRGAASNDDDVVIAQDGSSVPACSADMYFAYQSGQFASAPPMRFSCTPWAAAARRSALAR